MPQWGWGGNWRLLLCLYRILKWEACFPEVVVRFVVCVVTCCESEGKPDVDLFFIHLLSPQEKPPPVNKQENAGTLNILSTLSNGNSSKQKVPADGVHRIRVDFKVKVFSDHRVYRVLWTLCTYFQFFFPFGCLYWCMQASSRRGAGLLSSCGTRASHCGGFSCGAQALGTQASVFVAQGLISCDLWALEYLGFSICGAWASLLCGMWNFPGPKI